MQLELIVEVIWPNVTNNFIVDRNVLKRARNALSLVTGLMIAIVDLFAMPAGVVVVVNVVI